MTETKDLSILRYTRVYGDDMSTTIKIHEDTKTQLDGFREYKNESYDEVIKKVLFIAKNARKKPELSSDTVKAIEAARERMKKGQYLTEEELWKRLRM